MTGNQGKTISLGYFNLARGAGMILIVFGHCVNLYSAVNLSEDSAQFLFSGMGSVLGGGIMAAFFMISGICFFRRSMARCLKVQAKLLLRPYFVVAAAVILTKIALAIVRQRPFSLHGGEYVPTYLFGLNAEGGGRILGIPVESVSILWFVLALFGGWILYNEISQLGSQALRFVCVLCCVVTGYFMTLLSKVWPFCLPMAFLAAGYLAAGELIKKKNLLERKIPVGWNILIWTVLAVCMAFGRVNIVAGIWGLGILDVLGSFLCGFEILRLYACFMRREHSGHIAAFLEEIGFHSMWIICLHAYEKIIFPWYRVMELFADCPVVGILVCFAGRCAVMYILYLIIRTVVGQYRIYRGGKNRWTLEE